MAHVPPSQGVEVVSLIRNIVPTKVPLGRIETFHGFSHGPWSVGNEWRDDPACGGPRSQLRPPLNCPIRSRGRERAVWCVRPDATEQHSVEVNIGQGCERCVYLAYTTPGGGGSFATSFENKVIP